MASEALELGYALHVPLPCLPEIYTAAFQRLTSGETEDPCAGFQRLIARAESVQVIDDTPRRCGSLGRRMRRSDERCCGMRIS